MADRSKLTDLLNDSGAVFSSCQIYRYALWRWWDRSKPYLMTIGLNPSTADEIENDPTVRRCIRFSREWGYGGLFMMNLFAIRATDPKVMLAHDEPIGADTDHWLCEVAKDAGLILAAWGNHGKHGERDWHVIRMLESIKPIHCLKRNQNGTPGHPLYIKADTKPIIFSGI